MTPVAHQPGSMVPDDRGVACSFADEDRQMTPVAHDPPTSFSGGEYVACSFADEDRQMVPVAHVPPTSFGGASAAPAPPALSTEIACSFADEDRMMTPVAHVPPTSFGRQPEASSFADEDRGAAAPAQAAPSNPRLGALRGDTGPPPGSPGSLRARAAAPKGLGVATRVDGLRTEEGYCSSPRRVGGVPPQQAAGSFADEDRGSPAQGSPVQGSPGNQRGGVSPVNTRLQGLRDSAPPPGSPGSLRARAGAPQGLGVAARLDGLRTESEYCSSPRRVGLAPPQNFAVNSFADEDRTPNAPSPSQASPAAGSPAQRRGPSPVNTRLQGLKDESSPPPGSPGSLRARAGAPKGLGVVSRLDGLRTEDEYCSSPRRVALAQPQTVSSFAAEDQVQAGGPAGQPAGVSGPEGVSSDSPGPGA